MPRNASCHCHSCSTCLRRRRYHIQEYFRTRILQSDDPPDASAEQNTMAPDDLDSAELDIVAHDMEDAGQSQEGWGDDAQRLLSEDEEQVEMEENWAEGGDNDGRPNEEAGRILEGIAGAGPAPEETLIEDDQDIVHDEDFELEASVQEALAHLDLSEQESIKTFLIGADDANPASEALYNRIRSSHPRLGIQSFYKTRKRIRQLANLIPVSIPMCQNSCRAFPNNDPALEAAKAHGCPDCGTPVFSSADRPLRTFDYLPLLPRLSAIYANASAAKVMQTYRASYGLNANPATVSDVYDGQLYRELCEKEACYNGVGLGHRHFSRPTDVALGLWADGFQLFKRGSNDCWPLLIINYNLPPTDRFRKENVWLLGIIPGPKGPKDLDSFLEVFMQELEQLMRGVKDQWDAYRMEYFVMGAYLIIVSGDMPAVAKLMSFKGHRGVSPCRACRLFGCLSKTAGNGCQYYYPLQAPLQWDNRPELRASRGPHYDPSGLPMRTNDRYRKHVSTILTASNAAEVKTAFGINGPSIFSRISSIDFPRSFPLGFAHIVFLNVVPNLVRHAIGTFGDSVPNTGEQYAVTAHLWSHFTKQLASATTTVPAAYGRYFRDLSRESGSMVAEDWLNFLQYASRPVFASIYTSPDAKPCLDMWDLLAEAVEDCLMYSLPRSSVDRIRARLIRFVELYEIIYYKFDQGRLSACLGVFHGLLHIADYIEWLGPPWAYWEFAMERLCGRLRKLVLSRKQPYAGLTKRALILEQISLIGLRYSLDFWPTPNTRNGLPKAALHFRRPAQDWYLRGDRDKDDNRDNDDDRSDDEDTDMLALFHHGKSSPRLDSSACDLLAARLKKDPRRRGTLRDFRADIDRLANLKYFVLWNRLALGTHGCRIRAKTSETQVFSTHRRDASHVRFRLPRQGTNDYREAYGRVDFFYSLLRKDIPPSFWDLSPLTPDQFFQRRRSLSFAVLTEFKLTQFPTRPHLKYYNNTQQGTRYVIWTWDIIDLVGRIELDGKIFVIDRQAGEARAWQECEDREADEAE